MSRLPCVQEHLCPDFRAFQVLSGPCNVERTTTLGALISDCTYRLWVSDLSLGMIISLLTVICQSCALFDLARVENLNAALYSAHSALYSR